MQSQEIHTSWKSQIHDIHYLLTKEYMSYGKLRSDRVRVRRPRVRVPVYSVLPVKNTQGLMPTVYLLSYRKYLSLILIFDA